MTTKRDRKALRTPATINPIVRQITRRAVADVLEDPRPWWALDNFVLAHLAVQESDRAAPPTEDSINAELAALRDEFPDLFASPQAGDAAVRGAL